VRRSLLTPLLARSVAGDTIWSHRASNKFRIYSSHALHIFLYLAISWRVHFTLESGMSSERRTYTLRITYSRTSHLFKHIGFVISLWNNFQLQLLCPMMFPRRLGTLLAHLIEFVDLVTRELGWLTKSPSQK